MDFRTAEQKAEFDFLFKSFMETFKRQFNQIISTQNKINEQVKSIEVKNDEFFQKLCGRISEPESYGRPSNTPSMPQSDNEEEELVCSGLWFEDEHDMVRQPVRDGVKQTFEEGKSMFSSSLSQNDESYTSDTITQESSLFACEGLPTGNAQTGSDVFIVSESYYGPVPDQLPIDQCPASQNPTSVDSNLSRSDSNLPQFVECSHDTRVENGNPCLSDECSVLSSDIKNVSESRADFAQTQSIFSTCLANDSCSLTQEPAHFLITCSQLCDETMHNANDLPPTISRHGPDLQNDRFVSSDPDSEGLKAQTLTPFPSLGEGDVGPLTQEAFLVTGPSLVPPRFGRDQRPNVSSGTNQVSEAIVAQILALSFPKHGPDENITSFVGTSVLRRSVLDLPFPKHGPDILAFFRQLTSGVITQALRSSQSVGRTSAIRMAEGREAYGRLRPVRRPWF